MIIVENNNQIVMVITIGPLSSKFQVAIVFSISYVPFITTFFLQFARTLSRILIAAAMQRAAAVQSSQDTVRGHVALVKDNFLPVAIASCNFKSKIF